MNKHHCEARARFRVLIPIVLGLIPLPALRAEAPFALSEPSWAAGALPQGQIAEKRFTVTNRTGAELRVAIASDTHRLCAEPASLRLGPRETATVSAYFDTNGVRGDFAYRLVLKTEGGAPAETVFPVTGSGDASAKPKEVAFFFYYAFNCHECQEFLSRTVPDLERKTHVRLVVQQRDVLDPPQVALFKRRIKQLGDTARDLPAVIIGDTALQGEAAIDRDLQRVLVAYASGTAAEKTAAPAADAANAESATADADALAIIPVVAAGLLDGINPCVFSTLIFLLAYLAYVGRTKKQILLIGIVYTLTVFATYYLIGLGFFRVIQAMSAFPIVSLVIQVVLWIVLIVFGALSVHDFIKVRQNKVKEVKLQLSDGFKNRIHKTIRAQAASVTIVASSVVVAFLVTLFELACTGQIYLPTITALAQTRRSISDFVYLGIYNLAFVAPLVLVFFLTYRGLTSQKLTEFFQKRLALVKILTAGLFFALAVFVGIMNAPLLVSYMTKLFAG
jgi:cytochrome c biogenesis protein CcdA